MSLSAKASTSAADNALATRPPSDTRSDSADRAGPSLAKSINPSTPPGWDSLRVAAMSPLIVDDLVGAEPPKGLLVVGQTGGNHRCPSCVCQLDRIATDSAGRPNDQNDLARACLDPIHRCSAVDPASGRPPPR